ncbi:MAG: FadR/GntR family transcriptional regulator [Roseiarcus sp.]|jgi:DNA-binding FadR family transcriptional regulator
MTSRLKAQPVFRQAPGLWTEISKRTVRERISDKLASLIASGILHLGDELPSERELASLLSVSRETIRGAIQTLAAKGILEVSQGARTRVVNQNIEMPKIGVTSPSAINSYNIEAVHGARLLVERAVVAEAALRIDDETLRRLKQSLTIQKETTRDPIHFLICDREFHLAIYRCSANPLLADFVIDLYTFMLDHRRVAVSQPGAIERSYRDHIEIYEALRARDPEAVTEAFGRHIDRIYTTTIAIIETKAARLDP